MAKKEEEKKATSQVAKLESATTENIMDIITKGNIVQDGMMDEIDAKLKEQQDNNLKKHIRIRMIDSKYNEALSRLKMRKSRRDEDIKLEELAERGNLRRQICGAVVDKTFIEHNKLDATKKEFDFEFYGKDKKQNLTFAKVHIKVGDKIPPIDYITYDEAYDDISNRLRKKQTESDEQYAKEKNALDAFFGDNWHSDWRYRNHNLGE